MMFPSSTSMSMSDPEPASFTSLPLEIVDQVLLCPCFEFDGESGHVIYFHRRLRLVIQTNFQLPVRAYISLCGQDDAESTFRMTEERATRRENRGERRLGHLLWSQLD
jgi:hypothetical protein